MNAARLRYSDAVLGLFRELPCSGELPPGAGTIVSGEAVALERGAWVRFDARLESGRIAACRFRAFGCPHTLAAAAFVARALNAPIAAESSTLDAARLARELEVPTGKMGRLLVVEDALRALLAHAPRVQ
jgi:NifU-like protein involved in Fe-S cluster formation